MQSRQTLAQQLAISRDLTQKLGAENSSESEEEEQTEDRPTDPSNPWLGAVKTDQEVADFISGYRKFWDSKNKTDQNQSDEEKANTELEIDMAENTDDSSDETNKTCNRNVGKDNNLNNSTSASKRKERNNDHSQSNGEKKNTELEIDNSCVMDENTDDSSDETDRKVRKGNNLNSSTSASKRKEGNKSASRKKLKRNKRSVTNSTSEWHVETMTEEDEDVMDLFEDLESCVHDKVSAKINSLKDDLDKCEKENDTQQVRSKKRENSLTKKKSKTKNYMELPREKYRPEIDEELTMYDDTENTFRKLSKISNAATKEPSSSTKEAALPSTADIDPNKYLEMRPSSLETFLPEGATLGEDNESEDEVEDQRHVITEAFAGDDVVEDFAREKRAAEEADKPQDVDMTLPGWGSWAGANIRPSKRKRRRFMVRFPKKMPRRDENKGNCYNQELA